MVTSAPAPISSSTPTIKPEATKKPSFLFMPGHIAHKGTFQVPSEKEGKHIEYNGILTRSLMKDSWASKGEKLQKEIIGNKNFIYIKINKETLEAVEIGIHINMCKKMQQANLERIFCGGKLLPKDFPVSALSEGTYSAIVDRLIKIQLT